MSVGDVFAGGDARSNRPRSIKHSPGSGIRSAGAALCR